ncbi:chorismate-binding protein [Candidatus Bathyarchaeota archaeon]|nr:chorismate-binding protein [Candidatus Bathyarchaeota archaeon]
MAKCPKCRADVSRSRKTWKMAGRPDKAGKRTQLEIGLFDCPKCHKPFREVLSKKKI